VRPGGGEILRDVSFTVKPEEFTGLIGPNGAQDHAAKGHPRPGGPNVGPGPDQRQAPAPPWRAANRVRAVEAVHRPRHAAARGVVALGIDGNRLGFPLPSAARRDLVAGALQASAPVPRPEN
jgi:zinc/manganese transport system ATP-binding protein